MIKNKKIIIIIVIAGIIIAGLVIYRVSKSVNLQKQAVAKQEQEAIKMKEDQEAKVSAVKVKAEQEAKVKQEAKAEQEAKEEQEPDKTEKELISKLEEIFKTAKFFERSGQYYFRFSLPEVDKKYKLTGMVSIEDEEEYKYQTISRAAIDGKIGIQEFSTLDTAVFSIKDVKKWIIEFGIIDKEASLTGFTSILSYKLTVDTSNVKNSGMDTFSSFGDGFDKLNYDATNIFIK